MNSHRFYRVISLMIFFFFCFFHFSLHLHHLKRKKRGNSILFKFCGHFRLLKETCPCFFFANAFIIAIKTGYRFTRLRRSDEKIIGKLLSGQPVLIRSTAISTNNRSVYLVTSSAALNPLTKALGYGWLFIIPVLLLPRRTFALCPEPFIVYQCTGSYITHPPSPTFPLFSSLFLSILRFRLLECKTNMEGRHRKRLRWTLTADNNCNQFELDARLVLESFHYVIDLHLLSSYCIVIVFIW